jgi:Glycosyltransferase family 87
LSITLACLMPDRVRPLDRQHGVVLALAALEASMGAYLAAYGHSAAAWILLAVAVVGGILAVGPGIRLGSWPVETGLACLLAGLLAYHVLMPYWTDQAPYVWVVRGAAGAGLVALAIGAVTGARAGGADRIGWASAVVIALGIGVHVATPFLVPLTWDVGEIHRAAGEAVLAGTNPYLTHVWPGGFPYMPLSAVASAAGLLAGDVRWPIVAADLAFVALLVVAGRRLGVPSRAMLLGAIWLWTTCSLFVTGEAFYESLLVALGAASLVAFLSPRRRVWLAGGLIGVAAGVKQLGLGLIPFLPVRSPGRPAAALAAVVTAVAIAAPFAFWDLSPLSSGTVLSLVGAPPRAFALNLLNLPDGQTYVQMPLPVALVLATIGSVWAAQQWAGRRWSDAISRWLAGSATLFLIAFALNGIAFVNYYLLVVGLWLQLVLVADRRPATVDERRIS